MSLSQEEAEDKPRDGTTSVMTVNNSYYSDLSSDSSSVSTDLEVGHTDHVQLFVFKLEEYNDIYFPSNII